MVNNWNLTITVTSFIPTQIYYPIPE